MRWWWEGTSERAYLLRWTEGGYDPATGIAADVRGGVIVASEWLDEYLDQIHRRRFPKTPPPARGKPRRKKALS